MTKFFHKKMTCGHFGEKDAPNSGEKDAPFSPVDFYHFKNTNFLPEKNFNGSFSRLLAKIFLKKMREHAGFYVKKKMRRFR